MSDASVAAALLPVDRVVGLLRMQRDVLAQATTGAGADRVLGLLAELIEAHAPGGLASVLLLEGNGRLRTRVAPSLPRAYSTWIDGFEIGPAAGSCGTAAWRNEVVIVADIAADPLWDSGREIALQHGLRACWSTPVRAADGSVLGTFAVYYREPRRPTAAEISLVDVAAGIASIVIERERAIVRAAETDGELHGVERRYRTLVEQLPLVVYVDELDERSSNIFTSPQIERLLGYSVTEWVEDRDLFVRLLHPDDRDRVLAAHAHTHRTHEPLSSEYRLRTRDGRDVWVRDEGVVVTAADGTPLYLQGYLLDVSAEREAEQQLRRQALHDALTGLGNRAAFNERLDHALSLRRQPGEHPALLFADLDGFKAVNDRFGHSAGDAVLAELGRRLNATTRAGDTAARLGGDEFGILLERVGEPAEVVRVAERVHAALVEPVEVDGRLITVAASIGISLADDAHELLKQADAAMYRVKAQPGLHFAFFDHELDEAALVRSRRTSELADALERDELRLHFQPIVALPSREVTGYEALLRWEHPVLGELPPLDFVPLAEESGLIVPIGRFVLEEACRHGARLAVREERAREIAVNVSARQLQHPDFVEHVETALARTGLPPHCLVLEITESVLIDTGDAATARLNLLKEHGVQIALDDFGTGYGSLSYLQRLPVDIVKIDRSFTAHIDDDAAAEELLRAIVGLGHALRTRLVAEGIERASQSRIIERLCCQSGQGFHYGHPAAPAPSGSGVPARAPTTRPRAAT